MHVLIIQFALCFLFMVLFLRIDDEQQIKASYEMMTSNWKRFRKLRTRLRCLVRERNLEHVVNFTKMSYGRYLNFIESNYSDHEFKLVLKFLSGNTNFKREGRLRLKFENCIVDDIIVMDYMIYLIEERKGEAA